MHLWCQYRSGQGREGLIPTLPPYWMKALIAGTGFRYLPGKRAAMSALILSTDSSGLRIGEPFAR